MMILLENDCAIRFNFLFINTSLLCNKQIAQQFYVNNMLNDLLSRQQHVYHTRCGRQESGQSVASIIKTRPCNI